MKKLLFYSAVIALSLTLTTNGIAQIENDLLSPGSSDENTLIFQEDIVKQSVIKEKLSSNSNEFVNGRIDNRKNQASPVFFESGKDSGIAKPGQAYFSHMTTDGFPDAELTNNQSKVKNPQTEGFPGGDSPEAWASIMTEDFEGTFPSGLWSAWATTGYTDAYWDNSDCQANNGTMSGWCAAAGSESVDCSDDYPNDMQTYMKYGPFDLSDAYDAYINFYMWLSMEEDYDKFTVYVSTDDYNWYGYFWTGIFDFWSMYSFDLTDVYTLGNVCGESEVWLLIKFESDYIVSEPEGVFVDDIEIWTSDTPGEPILYLSGGGFSPNPVYYQASLSINAEITNGGSGPATDSEIQYYLSDDTFINGDDCYLGNDFVSLDGGASVTESFDVDLSTLACVDPGNYYVGVYFVDSDVGWHWTSTLEVVDEGDPEIHVSPTNLTVYQGGSANNNSKSKPPKDAEVISGDYAEGRVIVKFKPDVTVNKELLTTDKTTINQLLEQHNVTSLENVFVDNGKNSALKLLMGMPFIYSLEYDKSMDIKEVIQAYAENPMVEYAEPDYLYNAHVVPDDPLYPEQWGLANTGQAQPYGGGGDVGTPGADINAEMAWDIQTGSSDVTVAILDEGVDLLHPEFIGRLVAGYDYIDNDDDPSPVGDGAHGTACAGIAAAANDGVGVVGVAWDVMIMPVRVLGPSGGTNLQVSNGITFAADEGAHIISMSLGGGSFSSTMETAVDYAFSLDIVVLASAGNNNEDNGTDPQYPATYDNCISVGAMSPCNDRKTPTTCDGEWWWGSNYGGGLDFMAPGTRIYTTDISGAAGYTSNNYTSTFNGTSSACPFAAGIAALIRSENPDLTAAEVWSIMQSTCTDMGETGYDEDTGYGRLDAYEALVASGGAITGNEFTIKNLGLGPLSISSITDDVSWLSTSGYPATPFDIVPGTGQMVTIDIDWGLLGAVQMTGTITIASNDADEPSVIVTVIAIPQELPDLVVENQMIDPVSASAGEIISTSCTVLNQGDSDAGGSTLKYHLSLNTTWDASDEYLGSDVVPGLVAGTDSPLDEDLTIPVGTAGGTWYILFFADADEEVGESDETNNVSYSQLTVLAPFITLDPISDDVSASSGNTIVELTSNVSWTVSETCDWLSVTPTSGSDNGSLTVNYDENLSVDSRTCIIEVSGDGASATYTLNQEEATPFITLNPVSDDVGSGAGSTTVDISSNVSWTVSETCDWVIVTPGSGSNNGTLTVDYDENLSIDSRSCSIEVSGEGEMAIYTLNQDGATPYLTVDPTSEDVGPASGSTTVDVSSNVDWTVVETCDWVSVTPTSGSGDGTLAITYDENLSTGYRSCEVEVSGEGETDIFTLGQQGAPAYIIVDPVSSDVGPESGNTDVNVSSNVSWTVDETCDWVSVTPTSGTGDGAFTVTYDENLTTESRSCELTVSGEGEIDIYTLNQEGTDPYIILDPTSDNVGSGAGSTTVDLMSNVDWTVSETCDWLSVTPTSGSDNGSLTVSYDENLSVDSRICIIEVTGDGASATYTLNQEGSTSFITLDPTSDDVGAGSGNTAVDLTSNVDWTVSETCDWLSVTPNSGSGDGSLTVSYDENMSVDSRTCIIEVSGDGASATYTLNQEGSTSFIMLDPTSDDVGAGSGNTVVDLTSNVDWIVGETCNWLSVTPSSGSGDGSLTVSYDENMSVDSRTCIIEVSGDGASATYTLNQEGANPYITIEPTSIDVGYEQNEFTVDLLSNVSWAIDETCDWLSVDPLSGINDGSFSVSVEENTTTDIRSCTVTVSGGGVSDEFVVNQDGTTSVGKYSTTATIEVYPNPTQATLNVKVGNINEKKCTLRLIDLTGNVVLQKEIYPDNDAVQEKLNLQAFANGVYNLQIIDAQGIVLSQKRIIKK